MRFGVHAVHCRCTNAVTRSNLRPIRCTCGGEQSPSLAVAWVAVILLNAGFAFVQEMQARRAVEALAAFRPAIARVVRDGVRSTIAARDVTGARRRAGSRDVTVSWARRTLGPAEPTPGGARLRYSCGEMSPRGSVQRAEVGKGERMSGRPREHGVAGDVLSAADVQQFAGCQGPPA